MVNNNVIEETEKIQRITFNILHDIDHYCKEKGLLYFLSGGSCLGAIRHKGFIPWDDDIDIMLPRPDYDFLINDIQNSFGDKYVLGCSKNIKKWPFPIARLWDKNTRLKESKYNNDMEIGIYVDIFPIDGIPKNKIERKIYYYRLGFLNLLRRYKRKNKFRENERKRLIKKTLMALLRPISIEYVVSKIERVAKKYKYEKCDLAGVSLALHYGDKETMDKKVFEKAEFVQFENAMFPVPIGYDEYLSKLYGDYMKIPPNGWDRTLMHRNEYQFVQIRED